MSLSDNVIVYINIETVRNAAALKNYTNFILSSQEMKAFIGILSISGYHTLPTEKSYWSEEEDLGINIVKNCMSRNEYLKIKDYS